MELIIDKTDKSVIFGARSVPERKVNWTVFLFLGGEKYFIKISFLVMDSKIQWSYFEIETQTYYSIGFWCA